jgi:predicted amidophosphoribosyltransferase
MAVGFCKNCQRPIDPFRSLCPECERGFGHAGIQPRCGCGAIMAPQMRLCYLCGHRSHLKRTVSR